MHLSNWKSISIYRSFVFPHFKNSSSHSLYSRTIAPRKFEPNQFNCWQNRSCVKAFIVSVCCNFRFCFLSGCAYALVRFRHVKHSVRVRKTHKNPTFVYRHKHEWKCPEVSFDTPIMLPQIRLETTRNVVENTRLCRQKHSWKCPYVSLNTPGFVAKDDRECLEVLSKKQPVLWLELWL